MRTHSDEFASIIQASHTPVTRADLWYDGRLVVEDIPISTGRVASKAGEGVRSTLDLTIVDRDGLYLSYLATDVLAPYGQELHIQRGVEFPDGRTEMMSCGWFRIQNYKTTEYWRRPDDIADEDLTEDDWEYGGASITITALDRMASVVDSRFTTPGQPPSGATVIGEIVRLTQGLVEVRQPFDVGIIDEPASSRLIYEEDRMAAVASLASAIDCVAYIDGDGLLRLQRKTVLETAVPLDRTYLQVVSFGTEVTRDGVYNAVVARGEQTGDSLPVQAIFYDMDPESPTRWYGPFKQVPLFYASPMITTASGAAKAAETRLRGIQRERERTFSLTVLPDPTYEVDDVIKVKLPGYKEFKAQIAEINLPLTPQDTMDVTVTVAETEIQRVSVGTGKTIRVGG